MVDVVRSFDLNFKFRILDVWGSVVKIEHKFYFEGGRMPITNRRFSLALEALTELKSEDIPPPSKLMPAVPTLNQVLAEIGLLPREALFLGVASDGLPVLLNLHDPVPGPILVTSDAGAGRTSFLQFVARGVIQTHKSSEVQFGVITDHPDEWEDIEETSHRVGIFSTHHTGTEKFLLSLDSWAHSNKNTKQSVLLLIDDLESVARLDFDALQKFRWLLLRGPSRRVWPIVTMNAGRYGQVLSWIPVFHTRIFGQIKAEHVARALGGDEMSALNELETGIQFSLRENGSWLRFWLPSC